MSFFVKYGQPKAIKSSKSATPKSQLKINIDKQRRLLSGETVKGVKGNEIRSWFSGGTFAPKLGIYGLFGDKKIECKEGGELEMLSDFEKALEAGEFDSYIAQIKKASKA
jgi:hypothetical protein